MNILLFDLFITQYRFVYFIIFILGKTFLNRAENERS